MRCRLVRDYRFEAAHQLPRVPDGHKCARMHGHSYAITVVVAGEVDPAMGWLVDFAEVDEHARPLIARLDHQVLNDIEGLDNPTSENLAAWLWRALRAGLGDLLAEVHVSETPTSKVIYTGE